MLAFQFLIPTENSSGFIPDICVEHGFMLVNRAQPPGVRLCSRKTLMLAVDYEQNTRNQRTDSRDDVKYCAKTYTKKTQAGDD
jgi:hypothetical protein